MIDEGMTRHAGYAISQQRCKRFEEMFGWLKMADLLCKTWYRDVARVGWIFTFAVDVYNLVSIRIPAAVARGQVRNHGQSSPRPCIQPAS
jgi:hypothetical protein